MDVHHITRLSFTFLPQPCGARLSHHQKHTTGFEKVTKVCTDAPILSDYKAPRHEPSTRVQRGLSEAGPASEPQAGGLCVKLCCQHSSPETALSTSTRDSLVSYTNVSDPLKDESSWDSVSGRLVAPAPQWELCKVTVVPSSPR